jgi:hypothetical protein
MAYIAVKILTSTHPQLEFMIQEDAVVSEALVDVCTRNGWNCACNSYGRFLVK